MSTDVYHPEASTAARTSEAESAAPGEVAAPGRAATRKAIVLLLLCGLLAYGNGVNTPFHMDDLMITGDERIKDPWAYIEAVSSRALAGATLTFNYAIHEHGYYGYHVFNLLIHFSAALALFGVVRQTLLLPRWQGRFQHSAVWLAFGVALLWMVHPLQTQAVTYIVQRMESMMGLFFLLTLYCLVRGSQALRWWRTCLWYLTGVICCALGALSKEVMVTILPVLLAYDFVFLGKVADKPRRRFSPMRLTVVAVCIDMLRRRALFYLAIAGVTAGRILLYVYRTPSGDTSAGFGIETLPREQHWITQAWVLLYYIRQSFIPYPQFFWYRGPRMPPPNDSIFETTMWTTPTDFDEFLPAGITLGLLGLVVLILTLRRNWIGFLGCWFFGILSLTSIIPIVDAIFEHRMYLSLASVCCLVVVGSYLCLGGVFGKEKNLWGTVALTCILAAPLTVLTLQRNEDYRTDAGIWHTVGEAHKSRPEGVSDMILIFWSW